MKLALGSSSKLRQALLQKAIPDGITLLEGKMDRHVVDIAYFSATPCENLYEELYVAIFLLSFFSIWYECYASFLIQPYTSGLFNVRVIYFYKAKNLW